MLSLVFLIIIRLCFLTYKYFLSNRDLLVLLDPKVLVVVLDLL